MERQTKSLEDEVALAQLFSSLLVAGEKVAKFSLHDLQRGNKGTSAFKKGKTTKSVQLNGWHICHSGEYLLD